ncbi:MAG: YaiI/YqxD family protein [Thermodesulfobacteriota bacterium]
MQKSSPLKIWVDSDACPRAVKDIVFRVSERLQVPVCLVANTFLAVPPGPLITSIQVEKGADIADMYIFDNVSVKDLVITADIPLAARVVEKGGTAINPRGEVYTEANVSERLSMRDFMQGLRDNGVDTGGPKPFGPKDRERFANSIDRILTRMMK